jgi:hypothetical protein
MSFLNYSYATAHIVLFSVVDIPLTTVLESDRRLNHLMVLPLSWRYADE